MKFNFFFSDGILIQQVHCISEQYQKINIIIKEQNMEQEIPSSALVIGYYPFRAIVQHARLLCQILHLPYKDRFFDPDQWAKLHTQRSTDWIIRDLPFMQDNDFQVIGTNAIITYIIQKANRHDIMGKGLADKAKVDWMRPKFDIRTTMIAFNCANRDKCSEEFMADFREFWGKKIAPILADLEQKCCAEEWYLEYFTILDIYTYELVNHLERMNPTEIAKYKKLVFIKEKVAKIPEIEEYEKSDRAVREYCPKRYFSDFKKKKLEKKSSISVSSTCSKRSNKGKMDLQ